MDKILKANLLRIFSFLLSKIIQKNQLKHAGLMTAFVIGFLCVIIIPQVKAACVESPAGVVTCTGDESNGIASGTDFLSPPATTLYVNSLSGAGSITPSAGTSGINFSNSTASSVKIISGVAGTPVVITTQGDNALGIKALSEGSPSGYYWQTGLGLYVPNGPAGGGGPVTVESYSTITTSGANSHGIFAQNKVGAYDSLSTLTLSSFSANAVTISLLSVAGSSANIGTAVTGDHGGTFTLNSNGTVSFDRRTLGDSLQPGESIITSVTYQVGLTRDASPPSIPSGSQVSDGTLAVQIVNENGTITVEPLDISFTAFGVKSDPGGATPLWPDIQAYVNRLKADEGFGGAGESIVVTNNGHITTTGNNAHGIYAETTGGNGATGSEGGLFDGPAGVGGTGSGGGGATVTANGKITTYGNQSAGVAALSRGGDGGTGGDGGWGGWRWGGQGGTGGNGGDVFVYGSGTVETGAIPAGQTSTNYGDYSSGIIALSEGGNGGAGGEGHQGMPGGSGGFGGIGGSVVVDGSWNITTRGDMAHGIWAKSVGGNAGSGGSGGWLGGAGGAGGQATDGGSVTVSSGGKITTSGSDSYGIYAESVGGFGGTGGLGGGIFYSRGGNGNSAGSGGTVSVTNELQGVITTSGARGHGIYAQSIGGGGGSGGGAGALVGFGGEGAYGGNGGAVTVTNAGSVTTTGAEARGIYAQSIGGAGGDGGESVGIVAVGGRGSGTSNGSTVTVGNSGKVSTSGVDAEAIYAQSIGGGGGSGGSSTGWFSIGGKGGGGGNSDVVTVNNTGSLVKTVGNDSSAIFAQSIGGGGGKGGNSVAVGAFVSVGIGGDGGTGGTGNKVSVTSTGGEIQTTGADSCGIYAQSVGGGGGKGGFATSASIGYKVSLSIGAGGNGGSGGNADAVTAQNSSQITTGYKESPSGTTSTSAAGNTDAKDADGIFAQSIGGGGGKGGFSITGGASDGAQLGLSVGGQGGKGGNGATVDVSNSGTITTYGDSSNGIRAQTTGGGGGNGGFSIAGGIGGAA